MSAELFTEGANRGAKRGQAYCPLEDREETTTDEWKASESQVTWDPMRRPGQAGWVGFSANPISPEEEISGRWRVGSADAERASAGDW